MCVWKGSFLCTWVCISSVHGCMCMLVGGMITGIFPGGYRCLWISVCSDSFTCVCKLLCVCVYEDKNEKITGKQKRRWEIVKEQHSPHRSLLFTLTYIQGPSLWHAPHCGIPKCVHERIHICVCMYVYSCAQCLCVHGSLWGRDNEILFSWGLVLIPRSPGLISVRNLWTEWRRDWTPLAETQTGLKVRIQTKGT